MSKLNKDVNGYRVQVFAPTSGATLPTSYVPLIDEVVKLSSNVTMTLNSVAVDYVAGSITGLSQGITYTFSSTVDVHKM